jgi:hypothetical protein
MEPDPGMLDVVLRARQECQTNAAQPEPLEGEPVDSAWGAASKCPARVSPWSPTIFDASEQLLVRNEWEANLFRKVKVMHGQRSSCAQVREGQVLSISKLWGEMALILTKLSGIAVNEMPGELSRAASSLMEVTLRYMETIYAAMREHAEDHAYQLVDPKPVAL